MELLLKENRKMASISNLTVLTVKRRYNPKKIQFTGAVTSVISIVAYTFSITTTGAMIITFSNLVAQN